MIELNANSAGQQAFLAGYIAAITTPDWRVGILSLAEDAQAEQSQAAFKNGARYFCGLCKPFYPPFNSYPTAASAQKADWQTAADVLLNQSVETIYVFPGASDPALLDYLAKANVMLIGRLPPGNNPANDAGNDSQNGAQNTPAGLKWVATIRIDAALPLRQIWPELLAGHGGQKASASITLSDLSPSFLSAARQRLVREVQDGLASGQINPATVPEP